MNTQQWDYYDAARKSFADDKASGRIRPYRCTGGCGKIVWKSVASVQALKKKRFSWRCLRCKEKAL